MRKLIVFVFTFISVLSLCAQTTNYAINYNGNGSVETTALKELDNSPTATFQMWIKPTTWVPNSKLISQDLFSIELGSSQTIVVKSGTTTASFPYSLPTDKWGQITVVLDNGAVKAFVNNEEQTVTGKFSDTFPTAVNSSCLIGTNFNGQLDEIRVWAVALEQKDFVWRNTLNKFSPHYDLLLSYWKCDQDQCENLVDYKFNHHGTFKDVTRIPVTDNADFRYRVVTGYTNIMRFTDRVNINRDMFLMTNDVILLSARVQSDGSLSTEYPDNSATPTKVNYLSEHKGRTGVMNFQGVGSQMITTDGSVPFDPTHSSGRGNSLQASIAAWIYIDSWEEGACIYSQYQDANNCLEVKLGSEDTHSISVNLCGTIGTLDNKIEVGKWHYLGIYLNPKQVVISNIRSSFNILNIGVDYTVYDGITGLKLSGKDMSITNVPVLGKTPIVIGKDFSGKMDEIMVWGSSRKTSAENDSKNGYKWNIGSWDNIYLNAYWKGDDPKNIGKDSQSWNGIADYMRNYYAGYRGVKIRLGIVSSKWLGVLNDKNKLDRMIADAKELVALCDGLDVDLEWSYSQAEYDIYNNIVSRLINEVIAPSSVKKTFTCSLHKVSYRMDKSLFDKIDYFTFQLYGPDTASYTYDWYTDAYNQFISYGFPKDKILLSYGVLAVNGKQEQGYISLFDKFGMNDDNYDPDLNHWNEWYFNGVNQVKRKQNFIIDKDVRGTMYFDMGNDRRVNESKSLIHAQNEILASNVDTLITKVDMTPTGFDQAKKAPEKLFSFYPNPAQDRITLIVNSDTDSGQVICEIFTTTGQLVMSTIVNSSINSISLTGLSTGSYLIKLHTDKDSYTSKLHIN